MLAINIIDTSEPGSAAALEGLRRRLSLSAMLLDDSPEMRSVAQIVSAIRHKGDEAVAEYTAKFDHVEFVPAAFRVPPAQIEAAGRNCPDGLRQAIRLAAGNVRRFQEHIRLRPAGPLIDGERRLEARVDPLGRVAVCVPGASAPLPSTVIMTVVPAQVAGVKGIVVVAPPRYEGSVHPSTLAACHELGITEIYRLGGAIGVAALAFGTETIRRVDKIVGPGSPYSQLAKKLVFGVVDIDSFAGTSEVLIIADDTADPHFVAADMLAQAEHDPGVAMLVTPNEELARGVRAAIEVLLGRLSRGPAARKCLQQYGAIVKTRDLDEAIEVAAAFAPEHLHVQTEAADDVAARCRNAGAIFVGHYTPESTGDYVAGPSHVLPTGGTARFWSALSVNDFLRPTSIISYTSGSLRDECEAISALAGAEGLDAHALSATIRCSPRAPREE